LIEWEKSMRKLLTIVLIVMGVQSAAAAEWSTDVSGSRATTLTCKGNGQVGVFYFENNGAQADKGCTAHCEWVDNKGNVDPTEGGKWNIDEHYKGAKGSVSPGFDIITSQNAKLSCE
jgi:hypothetical protein